MNESTDSKILVIEDNIDDQELLLRRLQKSGVDQMVLCVRMVTKRSNLPRC
jgi:hypothetical protein